jgi:hypothetical protein
MVIPVVKLHMYYSLKLDDNLDVIFEDIEMLDLDSLNNALKTKNVDFVSIIKNRFTIDSKHHITINGYRINDTTFFIPKALIDELSFVTYEIAEKNILTGIEYLYHMYHNLKT